VHGLASDVERAWLHRTTGRSWLREFLPDGLGQHRARIMTYRHDSRWQSYTLRKSFDGFAKDLLEALTAARSSPEEQERAIIFIGHSFGGLLIKQALVMAGGKGSRYRNISDRAVGIIFLGVPHHGSNTLLHRVGWALAALYKLSESRTDLLSLAKGSPELDRLHDGFLLSYKTVDCICFYECVPEYAFGISIGPVFGLVSFSRGPK